MAAEPGDGASGVTDPGDDWLRSSLRAGFAYSHHAVRQADMPDPERKFYSIVRLTNVFPVVLLLKLKYN